MTSISNVSSFGVRPSNIGGSFIEESAMRASVLGGGAIIKSSKGVTQNDIVIPTGPPVLISSVFTPLPTREVQSNTQQLQQEVVYIDKPVYIQKKVEVPVYVDRYVDRPIYVKSQEQMKPPEPIYIEKKVQVPVYIQKEVEKIIYVNQPQMPVTLQPQLETQVPVGRQPIISTGQFVNHPEEGICYECTAFCSGCRCSNLCSSCRGCCYPTCAGCANCNCCSGICKKFKNCCPRIYGMPWWIPVLLGLLALGGLITALVFGLRGHNSERSESTVESEQKCEGGFFMFQNRCVKCPEGSRFNGTNCIKTVCVTVSKVPGRIPGKLCNSTDQKLERRS